MSERNAPWYVRIAAFDHKAAVLCDASLVTELHTDNQSHPGRYSVYLLELPWRKCESCRYRHVASGGQCVIETDSKLDAERTFEGVELMMRGHLNDPHPVIEIERTVRA